MQTVVTDGAVAEKVSAGAHQPVVVDGGHDRNRRVPARVQDGGTEQRESIVDVDDVGRYPAQHRGQLTAGLAAPDHPGRQRRLFRR